MEKLKLTEHQLLIYESRFPELLEFREYSPHEISEAAKAFSSGDVSEKEILVRWLSAEEYAALVSAVVRAQGAGELRADLDPAVAATLLASIPAPMFKSHDVPVEEVVDLLLKGMGA